MIEKDRFHPSAMGPPPETPPVEAFEMPAEYYDRLSMRVQRPLLLTFLVTAMVVALVALLPTVFESETPRYHILVIGGALLAAMLAATGVFLRRAAEEDSLGQQLALLVFNGLQTTFWTLIALMSAQVFQTVLPFGYILPCIMGNCFGLRRKWLIAVNCSMVTIGYGAIATLGANSLLMSISNGLMMLGVMVVTVATSVFFERDGRRRRRIAAERRRMVAGLEILYQKAVAAETAKTAFLASVSHELRTPLNAVIGFAQAMRYEIYGPLGSDKYMEYAGDIEQSGVHLLNIVNDLIDLSRADMGKMELRLAPVPAQPFAKNLARIAQEQADLENVRLEIHPYNLPIESFIMDETRMRQAAINIISNAIKFTPVDATVALRWLIDDSGRVLLRVEDEGPGIPEDQLENVLKPFHQLRQGQGPRNAGLGIGLNLTLHIMRAHKGELSMRSCEGVGTTVELILPRPCANQSAHSLNRSAAPAA